MKYILVTGDIHPIGGMQLLSAGVAEVMEKKGWEVYIFFPSHTKGNCALPYLNKFNDGGFCELTLPPYKWMARTRRYVIDRMCQIIGEVHEGEEIIIESHSDRTSQWGELLAQRLNAKHMLFLCNETYRGKDKFYLENLDYYDFKHKRKEVAGEMDDILYKLFEGYKRVENDELYIFKYDENPVRDVKDNRVSSIKKYDYNICYIGRVEKGYVPNIVKGIAKFAKDNKKKSIQFVIVGDTSSQKKLLDESFKDINNLIVTELGNVVPIPKELFTKVDVVIAGSGSAKCAAYEGVYTIVADASNFLANGVLGYDTNDELYHSNVIQMSFDEALANVLIEKKYDNMKCILPPYMGPKECVEYNFKLIKNSVQTKEFYPEKKLCMPKTNYIDAAKMRVYDWICKHIPKFSILLLNIKRKVIAK